VVVEYGVGYGWNLAGLACGRRIGYDLSDAVAPIVRAHGIEFAESLQELADGLADIVICHHVLEHVQSPLESLAGIQRLLMPGGKLLLTVPYEMQRRFRRYDPDEPNHHIYSWTPQSLGNLLAVAGFSLNSMAVKKCGYDRFAAVLADRLRGGEFGFRVIGCIGRLLRPWHEIQAVASLNTP
jgi:SAM-dependent methyltransferase